MVPCSMMIMPSNVFEIRSSMGSREHIAVQEDTSHREVGSKVVGFVFLFSGLCF